jgi:hypothetical protein
MTFHRLRVVVSLLLAVLPAAPALAAAFQPDPSEVARAIRDRGIYVDSGSDLSEGRAAELVAAVRNDGERLSIVVLDEDAATGAVAFGDAVVDRLPNPGLILVVSPGDFGVVGEAEAYTSAELDAALTAAENAGDTDSSLVEAFVASLIGVEAGIDLPAGTAVPEPFDESAVGANDGGGGFPWWLVLFLLGGGLFVFWMVRRSRKRAALADEARLAQARAEIQTQLDAVANDILEMEDEVRVADRTQVDELYQAAAQTYQTASEELASADTPAEFLEITNKLDVAVWQLDSVEALLDGKTPPPQPIPKRLEPAPTPSPPPPAPSREGEGGLGLPPKPSYPPSGPDYERRPSRRSGGLSPSLIEMLIALGAGALGSQQSSRGGLFPRRSSTSPPPPPPRPATPPPSSSSSTGKGTGGRIRMGRRRRRR